MYYIHIRMVWKGAKEKQAAPARRHLFFLRHSRTDRLRQQTVERDSVGVMSDYKHKNKQA